ncbi:MAG: hypothetical protein ACYC1B_01920, partial [Thermoleophilia bacterium]
MTRNEFSGDLIGIHLHDASGSKVYGNDFFGSEWWDIQLSNGDSNAIFRNNFLNDQNNYVLADI